MVVWGTCLAAGLASQTLYSTIICSSAASITLTNHIDCHVVSCLIHISLNWKIPPTLQMDICLHFTSRIQSSRFNILSSPQDCVNFILHYPLEGHGVRQIVISLRCSYRGRRREGRGLRPPSMLLTIRIDNLFVSAGHYLLSLSMHLHFMSRSAVRSCHSW